jgi:hypothetical protein
MSGFTPFVAGNVLAAADLNARAPLYVVKQATESVTSSTTLQNDDELVLTLLANRTYYVKVCLYVTGAAAGDVKVDWVLGTVANTPLRFQSGPDTSTSGVGATTVRKTVNGMTTAVPYGLDGSIGSAIVEEFIVQCTTSNASLQMRWAQNGSSGTATQVQAGSFILATPIS